ncbi:uncharacterized protein LOC107716266 isoform X2 [Sinocyclocheilus rhinocerous]|uniref:uncharacterized protein LOC107716266 isoform X2 n=1 Tax=Sinocyclocheilus rhinocerous TaxID=307959 RepID=UPI0007B90488|nr:PREDICTED: uncharacterized protein LOC107716266 isoform X2 [Sinocyclocheilus rhinocerous]
MFFAFIFWVLTEDNLKTWIKFSSRKRELAVFTVVVYSVFLIDAWIKAANKKSAWRIIFGMFYGCVVLFSFILSRGFIRMHVKWVWLYFLSLAQFLLLFSSFGLPSPAFLAAPMVQAILLMCMRTSFWKLVITLYSILVVYVHVRIFGREKECLQWTFMVVFLEVLRIMVAFEDRDYVIEAEHSEAQRQQQTETSQEGSNALSLCHKIMFMFGAVGLVLLNSGSLTAELILKARNGEHVVKDLRVIVFLSECVFVLYWMILQICAFRKYLLTYF